MSKEYYVVYYTNFDKFLEEVNRHLHDGWELQGGCTHSQGLFVQALIRDKKEAAAAHDSAPLGATEGSVIKKRRGRRSSPKT